MTLEILVHLLVNNYFPLEYKHRKWYEGTVANPRPLVSHSLLTSFAKTT